jgi:Ser/Thr protein kinase RdoA (MazF antagonist)
MAPTSFNRRDIESLLTSFHSFSGKGFDFSPVNAGSVASLYRLVFSDEIEGFETKVFFLRIDTASPKKSLISQHEVSRVLQNHLDIIVPEIILPTDALSIADEMYQIGQITLSPIAPGEILEVLNEKHLFQVGELLAKIHKTEPSEKITSHRFGKAYLKDRLEKLREQIKIHDSTLYDDLSDSLSKLHEDSENTIIHGDLFADNLFWNDGEISAIIDFDSSGLGDPLYDLSITTLAHCFSNRDWQKEKTKALIQGYQKVQSDFDINNQGQWKNAWKHAVLRLTITRLSDFEFTDDPKNKEAYRDYRDIWQHRDLIDHIYKDIL